MLTRLFDIYLLDGNHFLIKTKAKKRLSTEQAGWKNQRTVRRLSAWKLPCLPAKAGIFLDLLPARLNAVRTELLFH